MAIDFQCTYDNLYNEIEANNVVVVGDNIEIDVEDGEGKFEFTLIQYSDANFDQTIETDEITPLGSNLYFKLSMNNPVSGLIYSLQVIFFFHRIQRISSL